MTLQEVSERLKLMARDDVPMRFVVTVAQLHMISIHRRLLGLPACVREPLENALTFAAASEEIAKYRQRLMARKT